MTKRHSDALAIWDGACNPSGICHSIIAAQREIFDAGGGTDTVTSDPAVRLMVAQLAYLCGVWNGASTLPNKDDTFVMSDACRAAIKSEKGNANVG